MNKQLRRIGIGFVNHSSIGYAQNAVRSALVSIDEVHFDRQSKAKFFFYIVDNSPQPELLNVPAEIPAHISFRQIRMPNHGYNAGLNQILSAARTDGCNLLVAGNPDVVFAKEYISKLISMDSPLWWVAVPSVINPDGSFINPRYKKSYPLIKLLLNFLLFYFFPLTAPFFRARSFFLCAFRQRRLINQNSSAMITSPIHQCDGPIVLCAGVQFIFNLNKIPSQFFLDESIFLWGEEASLSWRLLCFNQEIHYISGLLVEHVKSVSVKSLGLSYVLYQKNSFMKVLPYLLSIVR